MFNGNALANRQASEKKLALEMGPQVESKCCEQLKKEIANLDAEYDGFYDEAEKKMKTGTIACSKAVAAEMKTRSRIASSQVLCPKPGRAVRGFSQRIGDGVRALNLKSGNSKPGCRNIRAGGDTASCTSAIAAARDFVSDVGTKAAAKSGGLLQIAECNLGNPKRDCNQLLVKKLQLALPVKKSVLGSFRHIPILTLQSWFDFFIANSCMHILHGLRRPHTTREEAICTAFWQNYKRLHPQHRIFHEASQGKLCLERAVPLVIHGDEGRGRRHCGHFVLSFHSMLGMGFGKKKSSRTWAKMECNFAGHTYTNRFLIASLRKKDYSDQESETWKTLMEEVAVDAGSLWETGVADRNGVRYWGIVLGVIGDWPFLHKSASFTRSFNNIQKRVTIKNPPAGICHLCRAGQLDVRFEQVATRRPGWIQTCFTQDPFAQPSPFVEHLLHTPGKGPAIWLYDWFHTIHLGVFRNFLGSILALLSEREDAGNIDERFQALSEKYRTWCRRNPKKSYFAKLSKEAIGWDTTKQFPSGGWHKGALSTSLMAYVEERFATESFDDEPLLEDIYNLSVPFEGPWARRLSTLYTSNESAWIMTYFGNASNGTFQLDFPADTALDRYTHLLIYTASPLVEQTTPVAHLIYDMAASVSNITYQGKDLDLYELGGQIAWAEPNLMERVVGYNVYLSIGLDGSGRSQVGSEVPAGSNDIALFPEQPRGAFDFFTVFTRSKLAEQTTPAYLSIEDESSYARNVSFIDDDLDEGEIGGYLLWRIPEDDSEVTHYLVYLSEDEAGSNRSLLGNVTAALLVMALEQTIPRDSSKGF
eukprot:s127_g26.t1